MTTNPNGPGRAGPSRLWPGLVDDAPDVFAEFVTEPAFAGFDGLLNAAFCMWRQHHDSQWRIGSIDHTGPLHLDDPDGAHRMLGLLIGPTPQSYRDFAVSYFGVDPDPAALAHVFALRPLTQDVVQRIHPLSTLDDLASDIASSGYPIQ